MINVTLIKLNLYLTLSLYHHFLAWEVSYSHAQSLFFFRSKTKLHMEESDEKNTLCFRMHEFRLKAIADAAFLHWKVLLEHDIGLFHKVKN